MGKDQDEFMDLTQDDDVAELPVVGCPRSRTSSTSTEPYDLTQCEEPLSTQASKGKGKGKGNGKRTNTAGSVQNNAKKKAKLDKKVEKQKQASEKAAKKATADINKIYRPAECMKHMNIEMHPVLASAWYMADVPREAAAVGARVSQAGSLCDPGLVLWTRSVQPRFAAEGGQVALTSSKEPCGPALYVTLAQDIEGHVSAHTLTKHIAHIKEMVGTELTVVIFGVKEFFKTSGRKPSNSRKLMTDIDLEMAITDLLVTASCDTVVVNSPNELALLIVQFTKAIAEAPYKKAKRACDEKAEFYMKGDNKNCIRVDPDGNGLARLWQQMVAILPLSSLEVSRAVCGQYKSPLMLYEELRSRGVARAADVGVARAGAPGARARRVGPELAQKLYSLFTDDCGNVLIH